ncbi:MAG: hypothetical protein HKM95_13310 [Inquilinus sp.]|nr:hypothetical protein [Inquilinus sp.]
MWKPGKARDAATVRGTATGACVVCGAESDGSPYWVGIGPVASRFVPGVNLPLCGPACSAEYGGDDDWQSWLTGRRRR